MFNIACCLLAELGFGLLLRLGLDLVSGWSVVTHTYMYLYYFPLSLSQCRELMSQMTDCFKFVYG